VHWHGEVALDAEQVAGNSDGADRSAADEATGFLRELLVDGPVPAKQVLAEAKDAGIAERTLKRAKSGLGIVSRKDGDHWTWSLPGGFAGVHDGQGCQEGQRQAVARLAPLTLDNQTQGVHVGQDSTAPAQAADGSP
jgi:putative DNA primase/helicase